MRREFVLISIGLILGLLLLTLYYDIRFSIGFFVLGPFLLIGYIDFFQRRHTIRRNFPIIGHMRYIFEAIRPEINQYFVESNQDGVPFSREMRSIVYQRAKKELDTLPFGTQENVYAKGYEFLSHSIIASYVDPETLRVTIGGPQCSKPYSASILNISAMSYGALSKNAISALNGGAKMGNFYHNTGEGSISSYHNSGGGDLVWQIGTGYFGARDEHGMFCPKKFAEKAQQENVKMIELKISQGAKPGHGGILPGKKVTKEIAEIRNVPMGQSVLSPPSHSAFATPVEMMQFIGKLREMSGGKPVGFKLCIGKRREFVAICKAIIKTGIYPDFITVDGGEGGTGAAPLEFSNHIGMPSVEAIVFVHNCLMGFGLRDKIKIIAAGKVTTAFDLIKKLAIGADVINAARSFMLSLGCIQALRCHNNKCPTGITTNDPSLVGGLDISDKRVRVFNYHKETLESMSEMLGAMGIKSASELKPWHILRRVGLNHIQHYGQIYPYIAEGSLLKGPHPEDFERVLNMSSADSFSAQVLH